MLFRKKMPRCCAYCLHSAQLEDDTVLCARKGVRPMDGKCLSFRYDPCKRMPRKPKALDFSKYDEMDFSL